MTLTATDLRVRYDHVRQLAPVSSRTRDAYVAWFRQSCVEGNPPDALRVNAGSETERFFARVAQGAEGHCYWIHERRDAPRFTRDDGTTTYPAKWWWEHLHGKQGRGSFRPTCGKLSCITPEHVSFVPWSDLRRRFTDEACIGALQVVALRLGHAPTTLEYLAAGAKPTRNILVLRFGSWPLALAAAGLTPEPVRRNRWTEENVVAALRAFYAEEGFVPTREEWTRRGLSPSDRTIQRRFGWAVAWRKALA